MFGMVPSWHFSFLFATRKDLGVDFSLGLSFWLHRQYEFLGGKFSKLECLWLMMRLPVTSFNTGHIEVRGNHYMHRW